MRLLLAGLFALGALVAMGGRASAQPSLPSTFYGTASIDAKLPPPTAEVRGYIDGRDCTQGERGTTPVFIENGVAQYVIHVMHETQAPGCGREGKTVTFTVGGRETGQSAVWKTGVQELNLNAGAGAPLPLPTATPTPPAPSPTATPRVGTPGTPIQPPPIVASAIPTDDIPLPFGSQAARTSVTPRAPGAGSVTPEAGGTAVPGANEGGDGESSGLPYLLGGLALLVAGGAAGGVVLARQRAKPRGGGGPD
ncbi:MAG: hypothetical protein U0547_07025 [Dehalococcoidia bacterium]